MKHSLQCVLNSIATSGAGSRLKYRVPAIRVSSAIPPSAVVARCSVNAEMERQTRCDTTEGEEAPMGQRGAYAADTIGPSAPEMASAKRAS
jgi:hypothetical protein